MNTRQLQKRIEEVEYYLSLGPKERALKNLFLDLPLPSRPVLRKILKRLKAAKAAKQRGKK